MLYISLQIVHLLLSSMTSEAGRTKLRTPRPRTEVSRRSSASRSLAELSEETPDIMRDWSREAGSAESHCDTRGSWGHEIMANQDI